MNRQEQTESSIEYFFEKCYNNIVFRRKHRLLNGSAHTYKNGTKTKNINAFTKTEGGRAVSEELGDPGQAFKEPRVPKGAHRTVLCGI